MARKRGFMEFEEDDEPIGDESASSSGLQRAEPQRLTRTQGRNLRRAKVQARSPSPLHLHLKFLIGLIFVEMIQRLFLLQPQVSHKSAQMLADLWLTGG